MIQGVGDRILPGAAALSLVGGVSLLHPQDQVFAAMLDGLGTSAAVAVLGAVDDRRSSAVGGAVRSVDE